MSIRTPLKFITLVLILGFATEAALSTAEMPAPTEKLIEHQSKWDQFSVNIERSIAELGDIPDSELDKVFGMVVPHDIPTTIPRLVYMYSVLQQSWPQTERFIVIGPDHDDAGLAPVTVSAGSFVTKYGKVETDPGLVKDLVQNGFAAIDESVFENEHSVGSQVLLISKFFPGATIVPILVRMDADKAAMQKLGEFLASELEDGSLLIASVDFSHYLPTSRARSLDDISGSVLKNLNVENWRSIDADSVGSLVAFMEAMKVAGALKVAEYEVTNTADFLPNDSYTTGHVFGMWGKKTDQ